MVYGGGTDAARHDVPLRLGPSGTDAAVEQVGLRCTHHDAFRFFTPAARPRNDTTPTREDQVAREQPGCLHATMDLYKWAYKLSPAVPGELLADCFALAVDIRELDMRASPYDLADHGYPPVAIETAAGKAEYASAQRGFAARGAELRERLVAVCDAVLRRLVECLGREERLLPHDAGEHGRAHDRQAALVFLDDGVHAAGDAGSGGDAPVGVEGDRQREGGRG